MSGVQHDEITPRMARLLAAFDQPREQRKRFGYYLHLETLKEGVLDIVPPVTLPKEQQERLARILNTAEGDDPCELLVFKEVNGEKTFVTWDALDPAELELVAFADGRAGPAWDSPELPAYRIALQKRLQNKL